MPEKHDSLPRLEEFIMKKVVPSFRRYSEPCLSEIRNDLDCPTVPQLRDVVGSDNEKNENFNDDADCEESVVGNSQDGEEFDDDWFTKISKRGEIISGRVPPFDGYISDGTNSSEIPLLFEDDLDFKERTMRTFRRGMKKIWKRGSATITEADPTYKVVYLGNYLTGWAKGESCVEKPLHTIWKNYSTSTKPDVHMKLTVTQSGLKAVTKDHGLTEYWSHRITYCSAPDNLPRVFCWVYRHEGRKLKQELRCHAVLCSKESTAKRMASTLRLRLTQALSEFKRDKLLKQNARLSLVNSVYENPSLPRRKILLSIGSQNYRPPLERSKSAPKLMSIEESLEEEETSPKSRRKETGRPQCPEGDADDEEEEALKLESENADGKSDFKITNLNFVKKLCSSIENLVESTSSYGKKFLTERRSSKDGLLNSKKSEESILKKAKTSEEDDGIARKKHRVQKFVKFEGEAFEESPAARTEAEETNGGAETAAEAKETKEPESDEGSNSLQSNSSWSSDISSLATVSSEKSSESKTEQRVDYFNSPHVCKVPAERLHTFFTGCSDAYLDERKLSFRCAGDVSVSAAGDRDQSFTVTRIDRDETDSFSEEEDGTQQEEDVVSDESGYVELADHVVKRLSLDRKEKDIPYHQIIKSNLLRPRRFETSCLQV